MTSEFVSKMLKAKQLEWEAIKGLLPEKAKTNLDEMSDAMKEFVKECMVELYFSGKVDINGGGKADGKGAEEVGNGKKSENDLRKRNNTRKIDID